MRKGQLLETMPLCSMNKLSNNNNNNNSWFKYDLVIRFSCQTGQELLKKKTTFVVHCTQQKSPIASRHYSYLLFLFSELPVIVPFLLQFSFIPFLWGVGAQGRGGGRWRGRSKEEGKKEREIERESRRTPEEVSTFKMEWLGCKS